MSKNSFVAYWVEEDGRFCSQVMHPHNLNSGSSYESEVRVKYATNPIEIEIVPMADIGSEWVKYSIARLKEISDGILKDGNQ